MQWSEIYFSFYIEGFNNSTVVADPDPAQNCPSAVDPRVVAVAVLCCWKNPEEAVVVAAVADLNLKHILLVSIWQNNIFLITHF
jgi:hypothetical protein